MKTEYKLLLEGKNPGITKVITLDNGKVRNETLVAYSSSTIKKLKTKLGDTNGKK